MMNHVAQDFMGFQRGRRGHGAWRGYSTGRRGLGSAVASISAASLHLELFGLQTP